MENNRKFLYYLGHIISIFGFIVFFSIFITGFSSASDFDTIEQSFARAPFAIIAIIIGTIMSNIGKKA